MKSARVAILLGTLSGLVELGRAVSGLTLEAELVWLIEPLLMGLVQISVSVGLGARPSRSSLGSFLFVFGIAAVWDGSKMWVAHHPIYLLPMAALIAGIWAARSARGRHSSPSVETVD